jgi:pimeloyl-ACP methyl ester carboxylesterase
MAERSRFALKLAVFFGLLVLVLPFIIGGWLMWKRPLTVDAWMSRIALRSAGLSATELSSPSGRMTVWEGGAGPAMVLLHGAGDQAGAWARIIRPLTEQYRVVIPDLPGHWKSEPREGALAIDQVLAGVESVMEQCCPGEAVILVGNSMGGWLAFLYAVEHPDRVARIVAVNGGPLREEDPAVSIYPADRDEARETMRGLMGPNSQMPPDFVLDDVVRHARVGPAARIAQTADQMDQYLLDGRLDEVSVPVEIVWGDADGLLTMDYARRMAEGLPAARITAVKGCGHVPQRECPDRLIRAMTEALSLPPAIPFEPSAPEVEE